MWDILAISVLFVLEDDCHYDYLFIFIGVFFLLLEGVNTNYLILILSRASANTTHLGGDACRSTGSLRNVFDPLVRRERVNSVRAEIQKIKNLEIS